MVGPAGSISAGVFSCAYTCPDCEPCREELPGDELCPDELDDWAAEFAPSPASRDKTAKEVKTEECAERNVMNVPCLEV
jgi:murein endopeptidase